jgi:outer membrane protein TolC
VRTFCNFLIGLVTAIAPALCQTQSQPLSLEDCIRLARAAQSSITVARQETEISRYEVSRARSAFLPRSAANNIWTYNSPLPGTDQFSFVALNGIREYFSQFTVVQDVDLSGRLRAELARARAQRDAAAANLSLSDRDLRKAVTTAYYRVLLSRHIVRVTQDALNEARSFESRTRLLSEKGEVAQADVTKASSDVAFQQQAVNAAELESQIADHELASFWTSAVAGPLPLVDPLEQPLPAIDSIIGTTTAPASQTPYLKRPEFTLFNAQKKGLLAESRRARAEQFPQANLAFQYGIDSLHWSIHDRGYAAFVNLNIPVFDWFSNRNLGRQFQLRAQQVDANREIATRIFSKEYQDALSRVKLVYQQVALTDTQVKTSEENLRLSRIRYEGGEGTALDVVTAQNQLTQARTNYFSAIAAYLNAKTDLEVATGR